MADGQGEIFTIDDYQVPSDPNHLMYYVWQWFAQASGGRDEVIRHALAGEVGNDLIVSGQGVTPEMSGIEYLPGTVPKKVHQSDLFKVGASGTTQQELAFPQKCRMESGLIM